VCASAIADAVTEFAYQRDALVADCEVRALNERLGFLAHELRKLIQTATLAIAAITKGNVGLTGANGAVLDRSMIAMRALVDHSLADVRVTPGMRARHQLMSVADFIANIKTSMSLEAQARECELKVSTVDPGLAVDADRDLLFAAVGNLLQNAFKFTETNTEVSLNACAVADRIRIDVEDNCGAFRHAARKRCLYRLSSAAPIGPTSDSDCPSPAQRRGERGSHQRPRRTRHRVVSSPSTCLGTH
jgi:signal transduction histidine kinase